MQSNAANSSYFPEGIDGKSVIYRERLIPGLFAWLLIPVMTISLGIAYGDVYGIVFGISIAIGGTVLLYLLMFFSSPVISVDELVLRVGNARLPRKFVQNPQLLDKIQTLKTRRIPAPKNAYLVMRASINESVLVQVGDLTDPHPYWQFSTRNPGQLLAALGETY